MGFWLRQVYHCCAAALPRRQAANSGSFIGERADRIAGIRRCGPPGRSHKAQDCCCGGVEYGAYGQIVIRLCRSDHSHSSCDYRRLLLHGDCAFADDLKFQAGFIVCVRAASLPILFAKVPSIRDLDRVPVSLRAPVPRQQDRCRPPLQKRAKAARA